MDATYASAYAIGAVVGAIVVGVCLGLVPLILGLKRQKKGLAIGGFFACLVGAFIAGILLGAPLCGLFTFLICKKPKDSGNQQNFDQNNNQQAM